MNASNAARDVIERPRDRLTVQILANGRPRFEEKSETTQKDEMIFEIRSVFVVVVVVVIKKEGSHRGNHPLSTPFSSTRRRARADRAREETPRRRLRFVKAFEHKKSKRKTTLVRTYQTKQTSDDDRA